VQEGWILPGAAPANSTEPEREPVEWSVDVDTFEAHGALALAFVGRRVLEAAGREEVALILKGCTGSSLSLLTGQGHQRLDALVGLTLERSGHGILEGLGLLRVERLPRLRLLDISGCTNGPDLLLPALPALARLRSLRVGGCNMGAAGCASLLAALPPSVTTLDLRNNGLADEGAIALAAALPRLPALSNLNLARNSVGDPGAAALAEALGKTGWVRTLVMNYNGLGPSVRQALTAVAATSGCAVHF